ncbi:MAG: hypothetical protein CMM46_11620 [Rhodospirillaceae bacterium]|nr:hypothetical protein [Rhodospirillaceae bacterium]
MKRKLKGILMKRILLVLGLAVLIVSGSKPAHADGAVLCTLGHAAHQQGLFDSAFDSYTLCLEEGGLRPEQAAVAYFRRASVRQALGDMDGVIEDYTLAIAEQANFALAFNSRGETYLARGNLDLAMADFEQATAIDLTLLGAWQNLGYQHWKSGAWEAAIRASDTALLLEPGNPQRYMSAALPRLDGRRDLHGALMLADAGLALAPDMGPLLDLKGHVLALLHRPDDALQAFMMAMDASGQQLIGTYETSLAYQGFYDGAPDGLMDDELVEALRGCVAAKCDLWAE